MSNKVEKSTTTKTAKKTSATGVVKPKAAAAPKVKVPAASKSKTAPKQVPVAAAPVDPEPVPAVEVETKVEIEVEEKIAVDVKDPEATDAGSKKNKKTKINQQIVDELAALIETLNTDLSKAKIDKTTEKLINKYIKAATKTYTKAQKNIKKTSQSSEEKKSSQSGFSKLQEITPALADFMGWPVDELKSRNEVNRALCQYIRDNDLQNSEDKRQIFPDAKLASLLKYQKDVHGKLDYARMQKFIGSLFVKPDPVPETPAA